MPFKFYNTRIAPLPAPKEPYEVSRLKPNVKNNFLLFSCAWDLFSGRIAEVVRLLRFLKDVIADKVTFKCTPDS